MNRKAKTIEQAHKDANEAKLANRLAILKEKGLEDKTVEKDAVVKKIKADIRKSVRRLRGVAANENLTEAKKQAKADKKAAGKKPAKDTGAKAAPAKEAKKEKKAKPKKEAADE